LARASTFFLLLTDLLVDQKPYFGYNVYILAKQVLFCLNTS
jgi:hypothetical protein